MSRMGRIGRLETHTRWVILVGIVIFLGGESARADFAIAGEWYLHRGLQVQLPIGQGEIACPPETNPAIRFVPRSATPVPVMAPCVRKQVPDLPSIFPPAVAAAVVAQSGVTAPPQRVTAPTTAPAALQPGSPIRIPAGAFIRSQPNQVMNPTFWPRQGPGPNLQTSFLFAGPATMRAATPNSAGGQAAAIPSQTRLLQPNAWSALGQPSRVNANFSAASLTPAGSEAHRVAYTAGSNAFGGTMSLFISGAGLRTDVIDLIPFGTYTPVARTSPLQVSRGITTVPVGAGYATTRMQIRAGGAAYASFNTPVACTGSIPPSPAGCGLLTGLANPVATFSGATTHVEGFPWTTGRVVVYARGVPFGFPQTTTLTAEGSDTLSPASGLRTIQLVAGGLAIRNVPGIGTIRKAYLDTVTIRVPEPKATAGLIGTLGLVGLLYRGRLRAEDLRAGN